MKRYDAARADLQYLTDPAARTVTIAELERIDAGAFDRQAAADRFADPAYRGQVHSAPDPTPTPGDHP